ncbi:PepSY-associated TM helix domain-containing protein [Shewanella sp. UCD-KL12]|uniref:PepSY-associated TM helix domain-containing protein n=1 Tax=Shewanella sp. UCD-KL12 TaxID=1917163 RepID=UPI0009714AB0|nr:PepSY-associated TM helix domain-containing protein [Shewanella sp. UCD-KL12]
MTQNHRSIHKASLKRKRHKTHLGKRLAKQLRPWHRRLGIFCAIFIILMATSGVVINHSNQLTVDTASVEQKWLLDYYGIKPPANISIYQTTPNNIASSDNLIWINQQLAVEGDSDIKGIVSVGNMFVAVDSNQLYILSKDGELMEKQDTSMGLPRGIEAIGVESRAIEATESRGQIWLKAQGGYFMADDDLIEWTQAMPFAPIPWAAPITTEQASKSSQDISLMARSSHLTWERVLLDVHSGRFFGSLGPWFMDLVALSLIVMAISGIYLWQQGKPKKKGASARN